MNEEQYLLSMIDLLRREYEKAVQPYVDRLVALKSLQLPPVLVPVEQLPASMLEKLDG